VETKTQTVTDIKVLDSAEGIVEAYVNTMGAVDSDGDVIEASAFDISISKNMPIAVLSGHDSTKIIGKVLSAYSVPESNGTARLYNKIQFNLDTQIGNESFSNIAGGFVDQWSVGFNIPDGGAEIVQHGATAIRVIKEVDWVEVSSVIRGASPNTTTISATDNEELADRRRRRRYEDEPVDLTKQVTETADDLAADDEVPLVTEAFVPATDEQRQQVQAKITELRARQLGFRLQNRSE
jgi:HK97 family phage prohead protease|tara:strand:+ start:536 stop:1249 length:714 start_codon:yes stop_codon:yes gene_type:complete